MEVADSSAVVKFASTTTIANDLTITSGTFQGDAGVEVLTVTGDVDVSGTLGDGSESGAWSFGSLTINSGGTYSATTGTTTLRVRDYNIQLGMRYNGSLS